MVIVTMFSSTVMVTMFSSSVMVTKFSSAMRTILCLVFLRILYPVSALPYPSPQAPNYLPGYPDEWAFITRQQGEAAPKVDYKEVMKDVVELMTNSRDFWPADNGNYGPLFIRLTWHNTGSYRTSDGRGGADGARQRFEPERSWADNTNLDKARALLWPVKQKYGQGLSWGDLFVLAGNAAFESMGGPYFGFCGGRIDADDGSESVQLGPSPEQEVLMPCKVAGKCQEPLGANAIGLIYVNPEGHMGIPDPVASARHIREVFARMDMNDTETVALIGGGHTFGGTHGACPAGAGPSPREDPVNPWPGLCGSGKGYDAFTSGFEFAFTTHPTTFDVEYFNNLINFDWQVHVGPGGRFQWKPILSEGMDSPTAPTNDGRYPRRYVGALTSDIALTKDEAYKKLVELYASDHKLFNHAWSHAWYKLTTRDMGPRSRCSNDDAPPPQWFQYPLPDPPAQLADFEEVKHKLVEVLDDDTGEAIGMFTRLAWQCSSTFRSTDYLGGCNGARIRFSPQKDWAVNINVVSAIDTLEPIKEEFGENLSWADLIILAGNTALEKAGGKSLKFCGGRTDATDGKGSEHLHPKITGKFTEPLVQLKDSMVQLKDSIGILSLTQREFAALNGAGYAVGDLRDCDGLFCRRNSFQTAVANSERPYSTTSNLSNIFFLTLLSERWDKYTIPDTGKEMYKARGKDHLMLPTDFLFLLDPELLAIVQDFAADNDLFLSVVASAWTKLSNVDRFKGPTGNVCD
eukprot:GFUD01011100.1.p1 GENE.GFUD01011100.1~~GFUD01011100.1.p1  ORF type:complete len:745 (-),score=81.08 GFUD01011100.1:67-2301(-)